MDVPHTLPDNIQNHWNQHGIHLPCGLNQYSGPHSLYDPKNCYTGYLGCPPCLANMGDAVHAQSGRATINRDEFLVSLDGHQFAPREISVKTVDNSIVVEANHEERPDEHGHVSRQFTRRYDLPKGLHPDHVMPELSSNGVLTIKATPEHKNSKGERTLQLQHTGPARHKVKDADIDKVVTTEIDGVNEKPKIENEKLTK